MARFGTSVRPARIGERRDGAWWGKVQQGEGCWTWTGAQSGPGYGQFWNGSYVVLAHRYGYEMLREPIPDDHHLDHVCRNTVCVKPTHLEVVTAAEHSTRRITVTHCRRGHELTPENTYVFPTSGARLCTTCNPTRQPTAYAQSRRAEWHDEAAALYQRGLNQREVADIFEVDASVICKILKRKGIPARPLDVPIDKGDFLALLERGVSAVALGRLYGCDRATIVKRARAWAPGHRFKAGSPSAAQRQVDAEVLADLS